MKRIKTHRCKVAESTRPPRALPTNSTRWRCIRQRMLAAFPECVRCGDLATQVDHIDNDSANNCALNLQSLCARCHGVKTRADYATDA